MKKKILFVINTLGGAGAEMALLELLEKLIKENEKTKDVQDNIKDHVCPWNHIPPDAVSFVIACGYVKET